MKAINQAGIPVRSIHGVGGGFEIMPGYKVDKRVFSANDLSALLMGLTNLSGMMRGDAFTLRDCPKPTLELDELLEPLQTDIKLRIHASVLGSVLDLCPPERVTPGGAEHYLVDCPFIERDYCYDMLLSLGGKCECLAPDRVRDEIKRRIQRMARIYGE